jgi:hypothetical protein
MTDDTPCLPNWPPPDGKISIDEAREIVAWIREHAGPVLEEAERMILERYPGAEIGRGAVTVEHLVKWGGPTPAMKGLAIGTVWCDVMAGAFAMVDIVLDPEGRLVTRRSINMRG